MSKTGKAWVMAGPGQLEMKEFPYPKCEKNGIIIKVEACGICGTDVHIFHGSPGATEATMPVVLGHEFSGEVVECAPGTSRIKVGDKVTVDPNMYCGNCDHCLNEIGRASCRERV